MYRVMVVVVALLGFTAGTGIVPVGPNRRQAVERNHGQRVLATVRSLSLTSQDDGNSNPVDWFAEA